MGIYSSYSSSSSIFTDKLIPNKDSTKVKDNQSLLYTLLIF